MGPRTGDTMVNKTDKAPKQACTGLAVLGKRPIISHRYNHRKVKQLQIVIKTQKEMTRESIR